jgi:acetoin utilization deacetylase AcuC-like enzyme
MTLLYYDPIFMEHLTVEHPERPARVLSVVRRLNFTGLDSACSRRSWEPASADRLRYVHSADHVESVRGMAEAGGGYLDADTVVSRRSYEVARMAAGAVCDAVNRVIAGECRTAFCLVRPPGHHATADLAMGFCLFNNIAIGARTAIREHGLERVLIVDFDVHHGNGTQAIFWEDPQVGFFSMHRSSFYPGTGHAEETGAGPGVGTTLNVPVAFGTPADAQLDLFSQSLQRFAAQIRPQLVMISAGFDAHRDDPIGSLGLVSEDFRKLTRIILGIADQYSGGRVVSVLEGGYHAEALADCVEAHLEELLAAESEAQGETAGP